MSKFKKRIIGIVLVVCVVIGALIFVNNPFEKTNYQSTEVVNNEAINSELSTLTLNILKGLSDSKAVLTIKTDYQKSITIETSIKNSDKNAKKLAIDIEDSVKEILESEELNSITKIESYKIFVMDSDGKAID
ncbi:hypothetical protein JFL43_04440 [Viridibacillus sp. YIM B01967]|uniref:Flagellar protein FliL n=1 Tax=Viridibacillus soli TaxID=2798301 RepID=A0ABS1H3Y8_9BACL|nr:hypothetical protein [Viridibacillus soli]MBK3494117.1 hypothetical protein [Viridibacillus soli]